MEFRRVVIAEKGKGVGQRAILLLECYCRDRLRRRRIWLDVFAHNRRARHIYEKLGYAKFGETVHNGTSMLLLYEKMI